MALDMSRLPLALLDRSNGFRNMKWVLLSPFTTTERPDWLFRHLPEGRHPTVAEPAVYQHDRSRASSGLNDWRDYAVHAWRGFSRASHMAGTCGVITVFPQLASIAGLLKRAKPWVRRPLVAWCFNMGQPYQGVKGMLARLSLSAVDVFVVHSKAEIGTYSQWLRLPKSRFEFVPLSAEIPPLSQAESSSPIDGPYVVALGTANRDYPTFLAAVGELGCKTIVVAGPHAVSGLNIPANVTVRSGLTLDECHLLAKHAVVNVIPIRDVSAASGQVTLIEAMMLGGPLVVTRCAGTVDYADAGQEALMVEPGDVAGMKNAISTLWHDRQTGQELSRRAQARALSSFTFKAVAGNLNRILDRF